MWTADFALQLLLQVLIVGLFIYIRMYFLHKTEQSASRLIIDLIITIGFSVFSSIIISDPQLLFSGKVVFFLMFLFLFLAFNLLAFSYRRIARYYKQGGALLYYEGKYNSLEMRTHGVSEEEIDSILENNGISDINKIRAILLSKGKLIIIKY